MTGQESERLTKSQGQQLFTSRLQRRLKIRKSQQKSKVLAKTIKTIKVLGRHAYISVYSIYLSMFDQTRTLSASKTQLSWSNCEARRWQYTVSQKSMWLHFLQ